MVRLKTRSVGVEVLGRSQPGAVWQVEADNADALVLYQPQSGGQNARVTLTLRG